jgi:hypothetical protein
MQTIFGPPKHAGVNVHNLIDFREIVKFFLKGLPVPGVKSAVRVFWLYAILLSLKNETFYFKPALFRGSFSAIGIYLFVPERGDPGGSGYRGGALGRSAGYSRKCRNLDLGG